MLRQQSASNYNRLAPCVIIQSSEEIAQQRASCAITTSKQSQNIRIINVANVHVESKENHKSKI